MRDDDDRLSDTENWIRSTTLGRRGVMAGGAAAMGYALAAQPVHAAAITTPATGLDTAWVTVPASGGFAMRAYRALPAGKRRAPVILVINEVFGLHEWVQDMVRRYALAGYYAIAPDLFQRKGDASQVKDIKTLIETIVSPTPDLQVWADLDATTAFAATDGGNATRLGVTGYCWGGRQTWLYAAHNRQVKAGVACYGTLSKGRYAASAIEAAPRIRPPVLGQYGSLDRGIPLTDVEAMNAALKAANSRSRIDVFESADHGFLADYRPSYNEAAARKAWADGLAWFNRYV